MWCIPPHQDARFVSAMEDVLEVYERPYDEQRPVICLDEAAKQILGEAREPLPLESGQVLRYDNEYERRGTCALFLLFEPLASWREVLVRGRRTQLDYAQVVRYLCDEKYPTAQKIVLAGALRARTISIRMEPGVCIKPLSRTRHSGWPNVLSGTTHQGMAVGSTWRKLN